MFSQNRKDLNRLIEVLEESANVDARSLAFSI